MFPFFYALKKKLQKSLVVKKYFRYLYQITITKQTIMKNSKEVLNQILNSTEQAAAIRRVLFFGMNRDAWLGCRRAVNALLDEAEQLLEDNSDVITDKDSFAARVAINRVLDIRIKDKFQ